jgi:hypothetical protein
MALIVNKPTKDQTYDYVPMIERGADKPFTVKIRRLTPKEFSHIEDKMARINQDQSISFTTGTFNWEVVKRGIVSWENLFDGDGKPIKAVIGEDGVTDESLNNLPLDIITEIANVIVGITKNPDTVEIYLGEEPNEETESN